MSGTICWPGFLVDLTRQFAMFMQPVGALLVQLLVNFLRKTDWFVCECVVMYGC